MAYIDSAYYTQFSGTPIPDAEFDRLAELASDIIDAVAVQPVQVDDDGNASPNVKKATAYQLECIYQQGGVDAVTGFASGLTAQSESLGSYSVGRGSSGSQSTVSIPSLNGIPISQMAIASLRKDGLMRRWAYAGMNLGGGGNAS